MQEQPPAPLPVPQGVPPAPPAGRKAGAPSVLQRRSGSFKPPSLLDTGLVTRSSRELSPFANSECQSLNERYDVSEALGQGAVAVVYKGWRRADSKQVALKVMRIDDEELLHTARDEFDILRSLQHPHIIHAHEFFTYPRGVVLVLDFVAGQDLDATVQARPERCFRKEDYRTVFKALMEAIAYLHERQIIHRDVKGANILVDPELQHIKLVDFNTACRVLKGGALTMTGTSYYLPPEVLTGEPHTAGSDVWAAGLCLHLMMSGRQPFERIVYRTPQDYACAISAWMVAPFKLALWSQVPEQCKSTLMSCLAVRREERASAAQVLGSEWLST